MVTDEKIKDFLKQWGNQRRVAKEMGLSDPTYLSKIANEKAPITEMTKAAFHWYFIANEVK